MEMTAPEYLKEKARMNKNCDMDCGDCPLCYANSSKELTCVELEAELPEVAISIVQKWAEEHPRKTMLMDFLEKYPKAPLEQSGTPHTCPDTLGYCYGKKCDTLSCKDCWGRLLEEED